ncbi:MAG: carboxymuconolactone decarboxylase family protein [Umezawaea sp.]
MSTISSEPRVNLKAITAEVSAAMRALHLSSVESATRAGLPAALQELVRIRVSQINGCEFCIDMHTRDARVGGESDDRVHALSGWRESALFDGRERAALALAEAVTLVHVDRVPDEVYQTAAAEFDEDALAALIWVCTVINSYNRIAISTRMVPAAQVSTGTRG